MKAVNVGYGNAVAISKITAIVCANSTPVTRLIGNMKDQDRVIDATKGHKCRSVVFTDGERIVLSAVKTDTLARRTWGFIGDDSDEI